MSRRISVSVLMLMFVVTALALIGCGGGNPSARVMQDAVATKSAGKNGNAAGDLGAAKDASAKPMIIYTYTLDVIVKDLEAAIAEVEKLVTAHKGYIAKSDTQSDAGSRRSAVYTLRIPVDADKPMKEALLALGTPERNAVETQDVGEEFVDVEKRIKNLKEQEDKLNELLKEKRKEEKLDDVIKVSDRIYLVRGEIEKAQGRREYLLNRTALSTMHVTLREIKDYKPPTAPTFGNRISTTFEKSWEVFVGFCQGAVLVAVGLGPWLPILLPALIAVSWAVRKVIRI